jgi:hypothetical protein
MTVENILRLIAIIIIYIIFDTVSKSINNTIDSINRRIDDRRASAKAEKNYREMIELRKLDFQKSRNTLSGLINFLQKQSQEKKIQITNFIHSNPNDLFIEFAIKEPIFFGMYQMDTFKSRIKPVVESLKSDKNPIMVDFVVPEELVGKTLEIEFEPEQHLIDQNLWIFKSLSKPYDFTITVYINPKSKPDFKERYRIPFFISPDKKKRVFKKDGKLYAQTQGYPKTTYVYLSFDSTTRTTDISLQGLKQWLDYRWNADENYMWDIINTASEYLRDNTRNGGANIEFTFIACYQMRLVK